MMLRGVFGKRAARLVAAVAGVAAAVCVFVGVVCAAPALAVGPWWHVTAGVRPGNLQPGAGRSEVQRISVSGVEVEPGVLAAGFELLVGGRSVGFFLTEPSAAGAGALTPTAAHVQQALEGVYGAGAVEVSGDEGGVAPVELTVVSAGRDAERTVEPVEVSFGCGECVGSGGASVSVKPRPDGQVYLTIANLGDAATSGTVILQESLPAGLEALSARGLAGDGVEVGAVGNDGPVSCAAGVVSVCTFEGSLPPYHQIEVQVGVLVKGRARTGEAVEGSFSGGGLPGGSVVRDIAVSSEPTPFAVTEYGMAAEEEGGVLDRQAGSHPFQLTTTLTLSQTLEETPHEGELPRPAQLVKDLRFMLPRGLIGNPTPFPRCSIKNFLKDLNTNLADDACAADTAVGVARVTFEEPRFVGLEAEVVPLFNLEPAVGEPARFGFYAHANPVVLDTSVRTGSDYGVTVSVSNTPETVGFIKSEVSFWGVPGDPRHDNARGWGCIFEAEKVPASGRPGCAPAEAHNPPPLLSMPGSCSGSLQSTMEADSWREKGHFLPYQLGEAGVAGGPWVARPMPALAGCNHLPFSSLISVAPDGPQASSPTGLTVQIHVPQEEALNAGGLAPSEVKDTTLALPAGMTLNPGGAGGLGACSETQIGYHGAEAPGEAALEAFSAGLPEPFCPDAAKVATVQIRTPLLPNPLNGAVYLASPAPTGEAGRNPFRALVAMYIVAEDPVSGTLVKLPGQVTPCTQTGEVVGGIACQTPGQLISTFDDTPQLPFEDLTLHFFGGGRAPLAAPGLCGSYQSRALFSPWSGNPPVEATAVFQITTGPNGSPCPSDPRPFTPELQVGTVNNQAGSFSELRTTMGHPDADQVLGALTMKLPPGLMGSLSDVKLCGEPQANAGTCGPESLIGHTTVTAGLGSTPAVVARPGNVYITGPYNGHGSCRVGEAGCAPFGLSIANPAETGPFDLEKGTSCDCIVVRAKVQVDPHTAQLTITSDPLPQMLDGIPLDLQHVSVEIDRPKFTFNPTSCQKLQITATLSGGEGANAAITEPFQAANCASLPFKPLFKATTKARHTRKDGAYLHVIMESKQGQADIHEVHVELPKAMPSELKTLQHACTEAQFAANPAGCPTESVVGHAEVHTPVLPVPLKGPAYFVSHGGLQFPELVIVLQGYGVTVQLNGETYIAEKGPHKGVTSSTFKTVPDVPFDRFDLTLPMREYSALGATTNFCKSPQKMPTRILAQSGKLIERETPIAVEGCKPAIYVLKKKTHGAKATLQVRVPSAGKLTATGRGIHRKTKRVKAKSGGKVKLTVKLTRKASRAARHHRVKVNVHLTFKPKHGKRLKATVKVGLR